MAGRRLAEGAERITDPTAGEWGELIMGGWWGSAPDGGDAAFLLLGTPDKRAPRTMPLMASLLGFNPTPRAFTATLDSDIHATISDDGWVTLHTPGGERVAHPVPQEWIGPARARGWVAVAISYVPMTSDEDAGQHAERAADDSVIGPVPLQKGEQS
jgi:hypothetical protein